MVDKAIVPDYALGNHVAPLGFAFSSGDLLRSRSKRGFIGLHGSWNRTPQSGYKVVFVAFSEGKPEGKPINVLTGFGHAQGRPVGVEMDKKDALLVADDVGNVVWRVVPQSRTAAN
jgi:glucose/arabinose dehydrogenase